MLVHKAAAPVTGREWSGQRDIAHCDFGNGAEAETNIIHAKE